MATKPGRKNRLCKFRIKIKWLQLSVFPHRLFMVFCYREFKLSYLNNLKLFLIRVKELFEKMVLQK